MEREAATRKSRLRFLLLYLLRSGPKHGYQLLRDLEELVGKRPSPGTLYPLLRELLREGLVEVRVAGSRGRLVKTYTLTSKGLELLEKSREEVRELVSALAALREARRLGIDELWREIWSLVELLPSLDEEGKKRIAEFITSVSSRARELRRQLESSRTARRR